MPRVSVEHEALHDPRLARAARQMRLRQPEVLGWRLLRVWSLVTETQSSVQRRCVVAEALRLRADELLDALVDVGLAELAEDERDIELAPLGALFGGYAWLAKKREEAPAGGRARAETGERDPVTGQLLPRDYRAELLALLGRGSVRSRSEMARALRADRARLAGVLGALVASGEVVETERGFELSSGHATAQPASAPAPVPALAPAADTDARSSAPHDSPDDRPHDSQTTAYGVHTTAQTTVHTTTHTTAQTTGGDAVIPETSAPHTVTPERALEQELARRVIAWLNGLHRQHGRIEHHRGFDPLAKDVLKAAKRWRLAKLKPEDVIAVCEHRIAVWRAVSGDWLNNCTPRTLFAPEKFNAALGEVRAGFAPVAPSAPARTMRGVQREGVRTAHQDEYTTEVLPI